MKNVIKFVHRGAMFSWGGPLILAIVWMCLKGANVVSVLTVDEVVLGIVSTALMAFFAAGISIIYQIEEIPKAMAGLIHAVVLYVDYLAFYLLNGWITLDNVLLFSVIFVAVFILIWLSIYIPIRLKTKKINEKLQ